MENKNDIQTELEMLSTTVASIPKVAVYAVPEGYFDFCCLETLKIVAQIPNGYTVSENYFQQFSDSLFAEIEKSSSTKFSTSNPYEIPENYFNQLTTTTLAEIKTNQRKSTVRRYILRLSVAAVVVVFLGFGIQLLTSKKTSEPTTSIVNNTDKDEAIFNQINETDFVQYLTENGHDVDAALVATLTDEQTLPAEEDYILDNNRLETYLEEININPKSVN